MTRRWKLSISSTEPQSRSALAMHFADLEQQQQSASLGMWIFLATEVMVFGGLFTGYTVYRVTYPAEFAAASDRLNVILGGINTVVLLTSSLTMALAVFAAQTGGLKTQQLCLMATALLGTAFLVIKGFEYYGDYVDNLVPGLAFDVHDWPSPLQPEKIKLFLLFYYFMTGLHAVHLVIGIGLIGLLALLGRHGRFSTGHYAPIEVGGLYWHFVDVIWIFLLPLLYLISTRH